MKSILYILSAFVLSATSVFAQTWTVPTLPPPDGNASMPLHTGTTAQVKNGDLSVNAFSAILNSYFASKVGIGTASPAASLDVKPTVTATSDYKGMNSGFVYNGGSAMTNYYAHYIAAPTGSGSITNKYALVTEASAGKVGIGTVTPAATLSVNGGVQIGDDSSACGSGNAGTLRYHGGTPEVCNGTSWGSVAAVASDPANCAAGSLCGFFEFNGSANAASCIQGTGPASCRGVVSYSMRSPIGNEVANYQTLRYPYGAWYIEPQYYVTVSSASGQRVDFCDAGYILEPIGTRTGPGGSIMSYVGACRKACSAGTTFNYNYPGSCQ